MASIDRTIFRTNDIRGSVLGENPQLTTRYATLIGKAVGTYFPAQFHTEQVYVGCDNRLSSEPLKIALLEGLISSGVNVTDLGEVLTPMIYYASAKYGSKGAGIMITGSHLPIKYNGIKLVHGDQALVEQQILDLHKIVNENSFTITNSGTVTADPHIVTDYILAIKEQVKINKPLSVVIDAGNGLSGTYIPPLLEDMGINVHCLYCDSDGTYPNHLPNPEESNLMTDLGNLVVKVGADLGIAFDGDADRCGLVDNNGRHISSDRLVVPLAYDLLERLPNSNIVLDVKTSQIVYDEIKRHGGRPVMWKTGHSLTIQKMKEIDSPLASDAHGHLYFGENYFGFDDAPLAVLKLLEVIAKSDKTVAELFDEIPSLVTSSEIILPTPDNDKFRIVEEIKFELQNQWDVIDIDGARVSFEYGWGLIRASNSQPAVTLRFEASDSSQIIKYMKQFRKILNEYPEVEQEPLIEQINFFSGNYNFRSI